MHLIINSIDFNGSIADGPGIRTVLYVQGCNRRCDGCHNPSTWDINEGKKISLDDLEKEIRAKTKNKKLTISGGEPLLQLPAIMELIYRLRDFNIALYTGYEEEEVPDKMIKKLDYIKVGKYEKDKRCTTVDYIGSTNQKFIDLRREKNGSR